MSLNDKVVLITGGTGSFGNKFYLYEMTEKLKDSDSSFISVDADILIEKRFIPLTTATSTYQIAYYQAVYEPHAGHLGTLSTSTFTVGGISGLYLDHDGYGVLRSYTLDAGTKNYRDNNFGTIDYDSGLITLTNKLITAYSGDYLSLKIHPNEKNIFGPGEIVYVGAYHRDHYYGQESQYGVYDQIGDIDTSFKINRTQLSNLNIFRKNDIRCFITAKGELKGKITDPDISINFNEEK